MDARTKAVLEAIRRMAQTAGVDGSHPPARLAEIARRCDETLEGKREYVPIDDWAEVQHPDLLKNVRAHVDVYAKLDMSAWDDEKRYGFVRGLMQMIRQEFDYPSGEDRALRDLVRRCPIGWDASGKLRGTRSTTDVDVRKWLEELHRAVGA